MPLKFFVISITAAISIALSGCDRDESIRVYQAPKEKHAAADDDLAAPATQPAAIVVDGVRMVIPAGWQRQPDQQMRIATFRAGAVEVIITRFGAESFAALLPNINRWRGQVGLEPLADEKDVKGDEISVGNAKAKLFDMAGQEKRMRVAVVAEGPAVWYFKIQGARDAVAEQQPAFDEFLRSVRFADQSGEKPQ